MKTRTLLLLALGCGLAIMVAGAAFFIRLAGQAQIAPAAAIGQTVTVGDLTVVVDSATESVGVLSVELHASGVEGDIVDDFRLIASGKPIDPEPDPCPVDGEASSRCVVRFDIESADGDSRVLFVERGDEQARVVLAE